MADSEATAFQPNEGEKNHSRNNYIHSKESADTRDKELIENTGRSR